MAGFFDAPVRTVKTKKKKIGAYDHIGEVDHNARMDAMFKRIEAMDKAGTLSSKRAYGVKRLKKKGLKRLDKKQKEYYDKVDAYDKKNKPQRKKRERKKKQCPDGFHTVSFCAKDHKKKEKKEEVGQKWWDRYKK